MSCFRLNVAKGVAVAVAACGVVSPAVGETYWLAGSDGFNSSSMLANSGAGWKTASGTIVKHAPAVGNTYMIEGTSEPYPVLRTPPNVNSATFAPELIVRNGLISLKLNNNGTLVLSDCLVEKGVLQLDPGDANRRYTLGGQMQVAADGIFQPRPLQQSNGTDVRAINIGNAITGNGLIHVLLYPGLTVGTPRTTDVTVNGDLSRYFGKIKVEDPYKIASSVQMIFSAATAFPGAMPEKTTDGFVLEGGAKLVFNASGGFDFNRGFVFGVAANDPLPEIVVAANQEVVIDGPVSGMVGFTKTGLGKLTISNRSTELTGQVTVKEGTLVIVGLPNATVKSEGDGKIEYVGGSETIGVTTTDYVGYEDDDFHGITVTIDRQEGVDYVQEWSEDGETFGPEEPKYQAAGEHQVWCRVSAEGYDSVTVSGKVIISLRTIVASMTAEKIVTADGQSHTLPAWTVSAPTEGYSLDWTVNGVPYGSVAPSFADVGVYAATCTITAPHYAAKTVSGTLYLRTPGDVYVDAASTGGISPYDAPAKAIGDIETALRIAGAGCTIHVLPGTYTLTADAILDRNMKIVGPADRSAVVHGNRQIDVKDGSSLSGLTFESTSASTKTLTIRTDAVVSNVLVRGGTGPVYLFGRFYDSEVTDFVGSYGVKVVKRTSGLPVWIERVKITNGHDFVTPYSAPIVMAEDNSTPVRLSMVDCEVSCNTNKAGDVAAGGIVCCGNDNYYVSLTRCRFVNNAARMGAIRAAPNYTSHNEFAVTNCLFADNFSRKSVNGASTTAGPTFWLKGEFVNCTFAGNNTEDPNGGLLNCVNMSQQYCTDIIVLKNCVISGNGLATTMIVNGEQTVLPTIATSIFPECASDDANGNLAGPAVFKGGMCEPYALRTGSPGIGAGALLGWTKKDTDLAGRRRVQGGSVDMGCYQSVSSGMMILVQ